MRCKACDADAEMVLMKVVPDNRLGVRGFEYHAFKCLGCNDVEQHRVFMKYGRESDPEAMQMIPQPVLQQLHQCRVDPAPGFLRRLIAKIRVARVSPNERDALRSQTTFS
jgi:hypothetical protein